MKEMFTSVGFWLPIAILLWGGVGYNVMKGSDKKASVINWACFLISYASMAIGIVFLFNNTMGHWWWSVFRLFFAVGIGFIISEFMSERTKEGIAYLGILILPFLTIFTFRYYPLPFPYY